MMEAALPSLWASLYSWCSPTVLFLLLNLVIGTIAVTAARHGDPEDGAGQPKLARAPSNIFGRLSSFKFAREPEGGGDQPKLARAPSTLFGRLNSFKFGREPEDGGDHPKLSCAPSTIFSRLSSFKFAREHAPNATTEVVVSHNASQSQPPAEDVHLNRSQSDAQPTAGEVLPKLAAKLKKSASTKSAFAHFVESDIVPPPPAAAAVEEEEVEEEEEEVKEVDVQADAFINRFRKQLQLQRLDSLMRYKEMLNRGR